MSRAYYNKYLNLYGLCVTTIISDFNLSSYCSAYAFIVGLFIWIGTRILIKLQLSTTITLRLVIVCVILESCKLGVWAQQASIKFYFMSQCMPLNHPMQKLDPTFTPKYPKISAEFRKFRGVGISASILFIVNYPNKFFLLYYSQPQATNSTLKLTQIS